MLKLMRLLVFQVPPQKTVMKKGSDYVNSAGNPAAPAPLPQEILPRRRSGRPDHYSPQ